jgi:hypothetical protein
LLLRRTVSRVNQQVLRGELEGRVEMEKMKRTLNDVSSESKAYFRMLVKERERELISFLGLQVGRRRTMIVA